MVLFFQKKVHLKAKYRDVRLLSHICAHMVGSKQKTAILSSYKQWITSSNCGLKNFIRDNHVRGAWKRKHYLSISFPRYTIN